MYFARIRARPACGDSTALPARPEAETEPSVAGGAALRTSVTLWLIACDPRATTVLSAYPASRSTSLTSRSWRASVP